MRVRDTIKLLPAVFRDPKQDTFLLKLKKCLGQRIRKKLQSWRHLGNDGARN